ncbi:DNA methyltransferase [Salinibacterium sp. ZJ70]|uniref:DNA methyltransferase n=1 Tax=Salinibacterium sp. ZJ70 TaxID=2708084 RepID=UPI001CD4E097|nr:DNA methyltransferase [Salinibacterium sp. ZJ70]
MQSDAFIVGESWISEHFFTTDGKQSFQQRVLERRKSWDEDGDSPRAGVSRIAGELASALARLDEAAPGLERDVRQHDEVTRPLVSALGFDDAHLRSRTLGPVNWLSTPGTDAPVLALVEGRHTESLDDLLQKDGDTLLEAYAPEGEPAVTSLSRLLSTLLVADDAPEFAVVLAGRWALLVDRERWPEGRYLAVDVQLVVDRNDQRKGGELDRLVAVLSAESLLPDAEGTVWWSSVREESIKHTVGVSQDLREGVRLAIEVIANDAVQRRARLGLDPIPADQAQTLAKQSLRFIYRILFLLYAESSPELKVLPVGAPEFGEGYGLDRLRELVLVELSGDAAERTHFYDSLAVLFRLIDEGSPEAEGSTDLTDGLVFNSLRADLFSPEAVSRISESKLSDGALQSVLERLLLSKAQKGRDRGFISYADLGINQLGAVYEGLMSYTGFFATEDLHEVAPDGKPEKGSWVVPVSRSGHLDEKHFVKAPDPITGEPKPVVHGAGAFVYRLSGRDRQQSASYYSPEVLTRFTVSQALEELLTPETTAEQILQLSVCEPALGSGAFAIEAVRQLAEQYLDRREAELGVRIDPDERPRELQKVKAWIALHQVYGVDLNATAVELAEISLWLDTMSEGLHAPWFGLRLRRGNSLVGARRAVFSADQVRSKGWLSDVPRDVPLRDDVHIGIHHFLLPADGWGASADAKEAKELAADARAALTTWRKSMRMKPTAKQIAQLEALASRVESLWAFAAKRLQVAEWEARRPIALWGRDADPDDDRPHSVSREQIEHTLADADGAYRRLRRVMDAWCALWFWPLTDDLTGGVEPPTWEQWIAALTGLLGTTGSETRKARAARDAGATTFDLPDGWDALTEAEQMDLGFASALPVKDVLREQPWLVVAERIAERQGFFHWELDFAPVFLRGGFDLQVGNPPWVRPRSDVEALLAEGDPWWQLKAKSTAAEDAQHREAALAVPGVREILVDGTAEVVALAAFIGGVQNYPQLAGLQPDLYRCFTTATWAHMSRGGSVVLIHPESHFTDEKAGVLRAATYRRLRRHWQFINELSLFEVHHLVSYGINVYGPERSPDFLQATSLYHPSTVEASLRHDGSGPEPGLKDDEGRWDLRPHASRIQRVDGEVLRTWHAILETESVPVVRTRMVYTVNRSTAAVLAKLSTAPRMAELGLQFSRGWDESIDRKKGRFEAEWGRPESWRDVILQGPHIHVATPFYKNPNPTMLHNQDWTSVDLEALEPDAIPVTQYKPRGSRAEYDAAYGTWEVDGEHRPIRDFYRIAWRAMAANTGERTFISALIPPGAGHVNGVFAVGGAQPDTLVAAAGFSSSLISDFGVRAAPKSGIYQGVFERLPVQSGGRFIGAISARYLRLVASTDAFAPLWRDVVGNEWGPDRVLRKAVERRRAQLEIDVLVALSLGITIDELVTIYRTQFPVLAGYDRNEYLFDANGRLVPTTIRQAWRKAGEPTDAARMAVEERTAVHPGSGVEYVYELPFRFLDREADMREAYARFEAEL